MLAMTNRSLRQVRGSTDATVGMICMAAAMLLLPIGDTFAKLLTGQMHPVEGAGKCIEAFYDAVTCSESAYG